MAVLHPEGSINKMVWLEGATNICIANPCIDEIIIVP